MLQVMWSMGEGPMATPLKYVSAGRACGRRREIGSLISLVSPLSVFIVMKDPNDSKFHDICISDLNQY